MEEVNISFNKINPESSLSSVLDDSDAQIGEENIWKKASKFVFLAFIFLLPVWVLPWTIFPLAINKAYLTFIGAAIIAILWLISFIQTGEIKLPKSIILLSLAVISAVWFLSALFSGNPSLSFAGKGYHLDSFSVIALFTFFAILAAILFQDKKWSLRIFYAVFASSIILFIFQLFRSVFNVTILPFNIFPLKTSNLFGSWNELGFFFGLIALESLIFLRFFSTKGAAPAGGQGARKIFFGVTLALSILALAGINFGAAWILLAVFSMFFLIYIFSVSKNTKAVAGLPLIIFVIAILFIFLRPLVGDLLLSADLNYIEVKPSWSATFDIAKSVLKKNPVLGSGPGTFAYNWLAFKSQSINLTPFWAARFNYGVGLIPSLLISAGILGVLAWIVFFAFLLIQVLKVISIEETDNAENKGQFLIIASFFGSVYLWIANIIYVPTFTLFALAFIFTGLFIAQLTRVNKIGAWRINFLGGPKIRFIASLSVLVVIIAVVGIFYVFSKKYIASYYFAKGVSVLNAESNLEQSENYFLKSVNFDPQDSYYRVLTETGLLKLNRILNDTALSADELRAKFQNTLSSTIQFAQLAVNANNLDPLNWINLAKVYEAVIPLKIEGASDLALNDYDEASKRDPLNPDYFIAKARVLIQTNKLDDAKNALKKAISLKRDYVTPNFMLAQIEATSGNLTEAIKRARDAQFLAPNDIGILFQLGLLYYQNQEYDNAKLAFEKAVSINQNYSNARYFLGLIYDRLGEKEKAIEEFEKIENLNPDNQEIKKILINLRAGKPALEEIAPPPPEKREVPPIKPKTQNEGGPAD